MSSLKRLPLTFMLLLSLLFITAPASAFPGQSTSPQFLPAEQAFAFDFQQKDHQLVLSWKIQPGYYLYQKQFKITAEHADIAPISWPDGTAHYDEYFGATSVYFDSLNVPVTLLSAPHNSLIRSLIKAAQKLAIVILQKLK